MSQQPTSQERIERAIERQMSPEEWAAFQADIIKDSKLREQYVEQLWLHNSLRAEQEILGKLLTAEPAPIVIRRWPAAAWSAAAAAVITLVLSMLLFPRNEVAKPVATLIKAHNCRWAGSDLPTAEQSKLGVGTLALVEGIATLQFESGATVTMEAPAKIKILNAMHCQLLEGSVTADVPEPAHGFTVDTPDLKLVDLGTRFGVTIGSTGNSQVFVFEGEVKVNDLNGKEIKRLKEGKGMQLGLGATTADLEPKRLQQTVEADGWTSIPTSFGRGKDAYARRGDAHGPTGGQPLLMIKHSEIPESSRNERRIYLSFDVSAIQAANISSAELVLTPQPSGLGFAALVPDSKFALYGITDETLDDWVEGGILWDASPASTDEGLESGKARKLAEFWMPVGRAEVPVTVSSSALAEFIREDKNGLASFVLIRETGESNPQGLVHAFASKEHPTAKPPTLRVK